MLRVVYAGSPDESAFVLRGLIDRSGANGFSVVGVLTNPPACRGRSGRLCPTPVQETAELFSIPALTPQRLDENARNQAAALQPDILVCFAYGHIFGPKFMALFPLGGINLHPSLLPSYRGCAPIPAAILNGDRETGVTVQKLALKMDSGNILIQEKIPLAGTETAGSLLKKASDTGIGLLVSVIADAAASGAIAEGAAQDESLATYTEMICKEDGRIDWNDKAVRIEAKIRAFSPWPGAFTSAGGTPLKIHKASVYDGDAGICSGAPGTAIGTDKNKGILIQTGDGILAVSELQRHARKIVGWQSFINGSRDFIGSRCI